MPRCNSEISIGGEDYFCEKTGHRSPAGEGPVHQARVPAMAGFQPLTVVVTWPVARPAVAKARR